MPLASVGERVPRVGDLRDDVEDALHGIDRRVFGLLDRLGDQDRARVVRDRALGSQIVRELHVGELLLGRDPWVARVPAVGVFDRVEDRAGEGLINADHLDKDASQLRGLDLAAHLLGDQEGEGVEGVRGEERRGLIALARENVGAGVDGKLHIVSVVADREIVEYPDPRAPPPTCALRMMPRRRPRHPPPEHDRGDPSGEPRDRRRCSACRMAGEL